MATLETLSDRPTGSQIHDAGLHADEATCPYCGAPLSSKRYAEIRAWIEAEERARIGKSKKALSPSSLGNSNKQRRKRRPRSRRPRRTPPPKFLVWGADIIHRVVHNGTIAGTIICDAKNRSDE
jgi:hypothetical protein